MNFRTQLWDIWLGGSLKAGLSAAEQAREKQHLGKDLKAKQLKAEVRQIAQELGGPIRPDFIEVIRTGAYIRVVFLWPLGKPGQWLNQEKKAQSVF